MENELLQYVSSTNTSTKNNNEDFFVDFDNLKNINTSCFAWIIVKGTDINYPVVQASNNSYYLTQSFDNSYNSAGWIYADYKNNCDGTDKNLVIFGHNRRDGSMFSTLKNILNKSWYLDENNYIISLYTPNGLEKYKVFSVYQVNVEDYYITTSFASEASYKTFCNNLKNRSIYNFNVDINGKDNILTLSTCSNNNKYRTVLHAKKIQAAD